MSTLRLMGYFLIVLVGMAFVPGAVVMLLSGWWRSEWFGPPVVAVGVGIILWGIRDRVQRSARLRSLSYETPLGPSGELAEPEREGDEFDELIAGALAKLPPELRAQISDVEIVVEDEPPPELSALGLYEGHPHTRRYLAGEGPNRITIYRNPHRRQSGGDPDRLARGVEQTVFHEIAHHFGISDARLVELDRY